MAGSPQSADFNFIDDLWDVPEKSAQWSDSPIVKTLVEMNATLDKNKSATLEKDNAKFSPMKHYSVTLVTFLGQLVYISIL